MKEENPSALKHMYSTDLLKIYVGEVRKVYPEFDQKKFLEISKPMLKLEMKDRVRLIRDQFKLVLPAKYPQALKVLLKSLEGGKLSGFALWPMTEFVQTYGLDEIDLSLRALKKMTPRFTAEWAIRPFIKKDLNTSMNFLKECVLDSNEHVRRWASEGSRPRLPWGERLYIFIEKPKLSIDLISPLKFDPSLYVRKSVANHLNDVAKDHPELVVKTLKSWKALAKTVEEKDRIQWTIHRALRTLIKNGYPQALALVGVNTSAPIEIDNLKLNKNIIKMGESLSFEFKVVSRAKKLESIVLDYSIHFMKSNGQLAQKVFKLKNLKLKPNESLKVIKNHSLREITTRKYYPGEHALEIQVNGKPMAKKKWNLELRLNFQ